MFEIFKINKRIFFIIVTTIISILLLLFIRNISNEKIEENIESNKYSNTTFSLVFLKYKNDINNKNKNTISENSYIVLDVPNSKNFKSYMDAKTITNKNTTQYQLKYSYELDYNTGIYTVNGRYCAALGSYYTKNIGTYFDVVMKSGNIIPCILADCKADKHTDELNQYTVSNNSIVEFVVDANTVSSILKEIKGSNTGDISHLGDIFEEELDYIKIYEQREGE